MKRKEKIEEFAGEAGTLFYGLATVPDDWMSQLKTYHNIKVEDSQTAMMWFTTMSMYIELLIARIDDLLDAKEQALVENVCLEKIVYLFELVNFSGRNGAKDKARNIENMLRDFIKSHRENEAKHGITIPQTYAGSFVRTFGEKMSEQILTSYLEMKVCLFEEENLRKKLQNKLEE